MGCSAGSCGIGGGVGDLAPHSEHSVSTADVTLDASVNEETVRLGLGL